MSAFFSGLWVILTLELRQRVRTASWYVLIGVFVALIAIVTVVVSVALRGFGADDLGGAAIYSTIIYFVLLLGTLVAPALSGNAINGDRDAGTLATTQVTLITTWQLIIGKFLAAWVTALAFLAAAVPFLIYASVVGRLSAAAITVSILILAIELGVVAAIGVGLSGLVARPLFSVVLSYLAVAALSIGTLIAFSLGGLAVQTEVSNVSSYGTDYNSAGNAITCSAPETYTYRAPRFDLFWGVLAANPYVVLADAVPSSFDRNGNPTDLFGQIKSGVRSAQIAPETLVVFNECTNTFPQTPSARDVIDSTTPGWFVGLTIHLILAVGALVGAWARIRTPAARLGRGSRIA
ncbi:ABC transporter permease [Salinibacterium sp. G-O1]|uniref:ABC transporter permease n=1 Tax=Salinibacterium sp. G-O1 TaxID=3046208 RepID=UPI0024B8AC3D|nr:ABC transporter permease [Salinibacterium sp. G-O1]MDJ0335625.1 ABC transporter permease [Salinibacterium sp. G-O1]